MLVIYLVAGVGLIGLAAIGLLAYQVWPQTQRERAKLLSGRRTLSVAIVLGGLILLFGLLYLLLAIMSLGAGNP